MDPSQNRVPTSWNSGVGLDNIYTTASMRHSNAAAAFGPTAGAFVPTPPSPEPEYQNYSRQPIPHLATAYFDAQRPPTPPRHFQDNRFVDQHHFHDPRFAPATVQPPRPCSPYVSPYAPSYAPPYVPPYAPSVAPPYGPPYGQVHHGLYPAPYLMQQQPPQPTPPIQLWPTDTRTTDKITQKKQEEYRKKGEEARRRLTSSRQSTSLQDLVNVPPTNPMPGLTQAYQLTPNPRGKRKSVSKANKAPTQPPSHRRTLPLYEHVTQQSQAISPFSHVPHHLSSIPGYNLEHQPPSPFPSFNSQPQQFLSSTYGQQKPYTHITPPLGTYSQPQLQASGSPVSYAGSMNYYPYSPTFPLQGEEKPEVLPAPTVGSEDLYQPITSAYANYKWPVKLYELRPDPTIDFAQIYLENWFSARIYRSSYTWHAHTTSGFIKNGSRFSILVLHNAANPFTWGDEKTSSTSIGVYGRYANAHNEIHWTTIAPSISNLLAEMVENGVLEEKEKWTFNMPKATEKRFHHAYWHAANMLPLGGMLNSSMLPEKPHDALNDDEMDEEEFEFTKEDLQTGEENEHGKVIWKRIEEDVGGLNIDALKSDHVVTGGKEVELERGVY
ncbi:transmembrane emp24 domain containing 2 precursor [Pyrenophora seminiperda CCB06]|uniref:Transmembrane emp24 domain containing 2 n=1 Tax=Pyrenophora seminiperda CCB06 TaxID=1302712 RepID=A0A3M7MDU2_9PLEO|nr:transmembrane emp24 domain containing 2 precursor [Pyrenophora seminiperda CCB06]